MFSYARNVKETMGTKFYILLAVKLQTQQLQKKATVYLKKLEHADYFWTSFALQCEFLEF